MNIYNTLSFIVTWIGLKKQIKSNPFYLGGFFFVLGERTMLFFKYLSNSPMVIPHRCSAVLTHHQRQPHQRSLFVWLRESLWQQQRQWLLGTPVARKMSLPQQTSAEGPLLKCCTPARYTKQNWSAGQQSCLMMTDSSSQLKCLCER